jgi:AraC-like DNA-binding protein
MLPMPPEARRTIQQSTLFTARGFRHHARADSPALSIKCMFNGLARYRIDNGLFAVDESGYLILNERQPYEIHIDSPTRVQSFVIFFPREWAADVLRNLSNSTDQLLDTPVGEAVETPRFFERFTAHDSLVSPVVSALRRAHLAGALPEVWVEQQLHRLLARMLRAQQESFRGMERLPAQRPGTRQEIWRRVNRARDFIQASSDAPLTLGSMAAAASLSSFHFLRSFKAAFQVTPHEYLSACRAGRARFLLERTGLPVTEICHRVGFESPGSFSSWFRKLNGVSPRRWRDERARQKSNSQEVFAATNRLI